MTLPSFSGRRKFDLNVPQKNMNIVLPVELADLASLLFCPCGREMLNIFLILGHARISSSSALISSLDSVVVEAVMVPVRPSRILEKELDRTTPSGGGKPASPSTMGSHHN